MRLFGNWAFWVPTFYISFVIVLVIFVIWTTFHKVELVDENYYDKEITYQEQINKKERASNLKNELKLVNANNLIVIKFPEDFNYKNISGFVELFRPSEAKLDFKVKISCDSSNNFVIPTEKMKKGLWKVKIDWAVGDSTYYNEEIVFLN